MTACAQAISNDGLTVHAAGQPDHSSQSLYLRNLLGCTMLSVDTRGGAIALFVVALLLLGALLRVVKYASQIRVM